MRDLVHELDGLAIGMAANSLARDTVSSAAREIERLQEIVRRLDQLATSAAGYISNKGIGDDFRKNVVLCQHVDLEPERLNHPNRPQHQQHGDAAP